MKFHNPKFWIGLGLAIVVIVVIAVTGVLNGDGSSESSGWTAGDRVVLAPDTGGWMPAAQIRSDLKDYTSAKDTGDAYGAAQMELDGRVVRLGECTTGLVLDTAFGGEMKLRIESGDKTGEALWTWGEWAASPGSC